MLSPDVSYFLEVVRVGGISRAAELLGLSQPALSKAVTRLERQVGTALLQRTPRGIEMTDAGRAFHERACTAALSLEDGLQVARDVGQGHAGLLRLGMTPATSAFVLSALLPQLRKERPASVLNLRTAFGDELFDALLQHGLSLAVGPVPAQLPDGLTCEVLYDEGFVLVHNQNHPLTGRPSLVPQDLEDCEAAAPGINEIARQMAEKALRDVGVRPPKVVVEANSLESLHCAVGRCPLITIVPSSLPRHHLLKDLVVRPLPLPNLQRRIGVFRRGAYLSPIGERAVELLKAEGRKMRPDWRD